MGSLSHCLNINQPEAELLTIHKSGYYDYLKSKDFRKFCLDPLGQAIHNVFSPSTFCLDVGCGGIGLLLSLKCSEYLGIDGSPHVVNEINGNAQYFRFTYTLPLAILGRMEAPEEWEERYQEKLGESRYHQPVIVFGGLFSVLIKPEHRAEFLKSYIDRFNPSGVVVYDLATMPEDWLESIPNIDLACRYEVRIPPTNFADIPPVKLARKFVIYRARKEG